MELPLWIRRPCGYVQDKDAHVTILFSRHTCRDVYLQEKKGRIKTILLGDVLDINKEYLNTYKV